MVDARLGRSPGAPSKSGVLGLAATAFLAMAALPLAASTFEFMVVPLQIELGLSSDQTNAATLVPVGASLLVVFIVGALGDRIGRRQVMLAGAGSYLLGAALVSLAWGFPAVILGRALGGIGALTMTIIGLAVVNTAFRDKGQRARVFSAYAALVPAVFVVAPLIASRLTTGIGWRTVPLLWVLLGAAALVATVRVIPAESKTDTEHQEIVTPTLAGVTLAGLASAATLVSTSALLALLSALVAALALVALLVVMRRSARPSLDTRVFTPPGAKLVFLAAFLSVMPNLFFYTNLFIQYRYDLALTDIALLMTIPQSAAIVGGLASAPLIRRFGAPPVAIGMFVAAAITSLGTLAVSPNVGPWVPAVMLAVCAAPIAGSIGPMTNTIMDLAPEDGSAAASSWRNAVASFGGAVGGVIVGGIAFTVFQLRLAQILDTTDLSTEVAEALADSVRAGAIVDELADSPLLSDPAARELLTGPGLLQAQSQALATAGVLAALLYLGAATSMWLAMRRRREQQERSKGSSVQ